MTEQNIKNKKAYLDLCEKVWDFDEESLKYVDKRISDEWEPVPEIKDLISCKGATYEDQRIRFKMDMNNPEVQSFFEADDSSFKTFKQTFSKALYRLKNDYHTEITYNNFITNKVIFRKNCTKIKKVFEVVYKEHDEAFEYDSDSSYSEEKCAAWIVRQFEKIGASKKSAKELEFVISLNPMDWLLASTAENFTSCFDLSKSSGGGYQYCLGLPFLCGDKNRMMLYISNGKKKTFQGITVDSVQTRTWCILDQSGTFNIVKWYPNDTIGYTPVRAITGCSNFFDRTNFTRSKYNLDVLSSKLGAYFGVYSDMGELRAINDKLYLCGNHKDGQQIFSKNLVKCSGHSSFNDISTSSRFIGGELGFRIPKWIEYGFHFDKMFTTLRCSCCGEDKAGALTDVVIDSKHYRYICYDCLKKDFGHCKRCGKIYKKSDKCKKVEGISGNTVELCEECSQNIEKYTCSCCGKFNDSDEPLVELDNGKKICMSCFKKGNYQKCDACGHYSNDAIIEYDTFSKIKHTYCKHCYESREKNVAENIIFGRYFPAITLKKIRRGVEI